jgi:hypothetical protein
MEVVIFFHAKLVNLVTLVDSFTLTKMTSKLLLKIMNLFVVIQEIEINSFYTKIHMYRLKS